MGKQWICTRQQAGRLVTELRMQVPRRLAVDTPETRRQKNEILHGKANFARRTAADRAELYLALLGENAVVYTMTYTDDELPERFEDAKRHWATFMKSMRRVVGQPFDYAYCIEGLHGNRRLHFHFIAGSDIKEEWVRARWAHGGVQVRPLLSRNEVGYHGKATYFTKERSGEVVPVGAHVFRVSRSLQRKLPKPKKWIAESGGIPVPAGAVEIGKSFVSNPFGAFHYRKFIYKN